MLDTALRQEKVFRLLESARSLLLKAYRIEHRIESDRIGEIDPFAGEEGGYYRDPLGRCIERRPREFGSFIACRPAPNEQAARRGETMTTTTESSNPRHAVGVQYRQCVQHCFLKRARNTGRISETGSSRCACRTTRRRNVRKTATAGGLGVSESKSDSSVRTSGRSLVVRNRLGTVHFVRKILDKIFQLRTKREDLVSAEDIGHLVAALDDLLHPQANICSFRAGLAVRPDRLSYRGCVRPRESIWKGMFVRCCRAAAIKITTFEAKQ